MTDPSKIVTENFDRLTVGQNYFWPKIWSKYSSDRKFDRKFSQNIIFDWNFDIKIRSKNWFWPNFGQNSIKILHFDRKFGQNPTSLISKKTWQLLTGYILTNFGQNCPFWPKSVKIWPLSVKLLVKILVKIVKKFRKYAFKDKINYRIVITTIVFHYTSLTNM